MILFQADQLLFQRLNVALQVQADDIGVIQELPQSGNVSLHCLPHGHLVLHPDRTYCTLDMLMTVSF